MRCPAWMRLKIINGQRSLYEDRHLIVLAPRDFPVAASRASLRIHTLKLRDNTIYSYNHATGYKL